MRLWQSVGHFFHWWWQTLLSVLPSRYRVRDGKTTLIISSNEVYRAGDDKKILLKDTASIVDLLNESGQELLIEVDESCCFMTEFQVPEETLTSIANVVSYEFDKLTPFTKDAVFYAYAVTRVDKLSQQATVSLLAIKQELVQTVLDLAKAQHLHVATLRSTTNHALNLLPPALRSSGKSSMTMVIYCVAGLLFICALGFPLWQKHQLEDEIAIEQSQLKDTLAKKNKNFLSVRKKEQTIDALWHHKQLNVSNIALLNDLSILIPADTHLLNLQRKGKKLSLRGESASASSLIALLESSRLLSDVRFSAAVTQLPNSMRERFAITAVVSEE